MPQARPESGEAALVAQAPPVPPALPRPASISVAVTGEILPHPSVVEHAATFGRQRGLDYDFAALFLELSPVIAAADVAICHLEVPVAPPGRRPAATRRSRSPPRSPTASATSAGTSAPRASNHVNDQARQTVATSTLEAARVSATAVLARTIEEAMTVPLVDVGGASVASLSYTWGYNATPPAESWMANVIDPDLILADAANARASGAAVVVVSLHWGDEYDTVGTADQRALAQRLLSSPNIDLIVGHGPHVLQPIEQIGDEYALLSVGNLVANQGTSKPHTYDGVIATVTFTADDTGIYRSGPPVVEPTWYDRDAGRVRLVSAALADPGLLSASAARTTAILNP
ncbi:MAG: CapA family protein [Ilumatobacteraceae bacterium]